MNFAHPVTHIFLKTIVGIELNEQKKKKQQFNWFCQVKKIILENESLGDCWKFSLQSTTEEDYNFLMNSRLRTFDLSLEKCYSYLRLYSLFFSYFLIFFFSWRNIYIKKRSIQPHIYLFIFTSFARGRTTMTETHASRMHPLLIGSRSVNLLSQF